MKLYVKLENQNRHNDINGLSQIVNNVYYQK